MDPSKGCSSTSELSRSSTTLFGAMTSWIESAGKTVSLVKGTETRFSHPVSQRRDLGARKKSAAL